ncbi:LOW QUALITY PROTEIN: protein NLRC5-like [Amphiura filiformis]|uniref:LOW QUALITY PROTEIN: protein NLRC5-like n=1 Tax=Amphiura filiformis TaxID=82378 RepID=UPI003B226F6C
MAERFPTSQNEIESVPTQLSGMSLQEDAADQLAQLVQHEASGTQYNVSGGQTIIGEQTNVIGDTSQAQSSTQGPQQRSSSVNFNLEECQAELKQYYIDEMGKVNLLPWVPDAVADMESIFVDLELVKQESNFRSSEGVKRLESNEDLISLKTVQGQRVNRVIVLGDAGSGKSTMAANIAYRWAGLTEDSQSPLSKFKLVFLISLHEIQDNKVSLVDLIFQLILPEDSQVSKEGLKSYITSNAKDVLLLIDGMDEDSCGILKVRSNEITKALHNRKLRSCCVILTTRPHRIGELGEHLRHYTQVKLSGFSLENIFKYIKMFFKEDTDKNDTLIQKLKQGPHILALAAIPVLLLMICLLWEGQCSLPSQKTQLYKNTLNHMWKRYKSKEGNNCPLDDEEMTDEMKSLVCKLGKVALYGIDRENEQVVFSEREFGIEIFNLGCQVGIITRERLRARMTVKESVTFLYKSFQDFCAGMYLAELLDSNQSEFDKVLRNLYVQRDDEYMLHSPYILDFCCGIQPRTSHILFKQTLSHSLECPALQGSVINISVHLSNIFESQLSYAELVSLCDNTDIRLGIKSVSYREVPYLLYLLKLSLESSSRHDGFILSKLVAIQIEIGNEPWLPTLLEFTPNLNMLDIFLGKKLDGNFSTTSQ